MPQVESLTVQILGDSSELQQELNSVADLLDSLQEQLEGAAEGAGQFGNSLGGLSRAVAPLQSLSNQLGVVTQQVQQLSSQTISLNVQPALEALARLVQAAQAAAAQLSAIGAAAPASGMGGMLPVDAGMMTGVRGYASGGVVAGPSGIDQVPAWLTAGEYVLNQQAVSQFDLSELDRLNRGELPTSLATPVAAGGLPLLGTLVEPVVKTERAVTGRLDLPAAVPAIEMPQPIVTQQLLLPAAPEVQRLPPPPAPQKPRSSSVAAPVSQYPGAPQTTNHFGGIEIHVQEVSDVSELMGDLRRQGIGQRKRWG